MIEMYADGSCLRNPGGPGGWGVVFCGAITREHYGGERSTTNNRMEMLAVIAGLETLSEPVSLRVYTDSRYVHDGATKWIHGWQKRGWKTASGDAVKNQDLWVRMHALTLRHRVEFRWVRGHNGNPGNERADALAMQGALKARPERGRYAQSCGVSPGNCPRSVRTARGMEPRTIHGDQWHRTTSAVKIPASQ